MGAVIRRSRVRAWLTVAAAAWAIALVVAGVYAARKGRPTVREQTTIAQALPVLDRAIAAVVAAAAGPQAVVAIEGYEQLRDRCRAGNRDGVRYSRSTRVYTPVGQEGALVDRIARALPRSWKAAAGGPRDARRLRADAGFFVRLGGGQVGSGELRFSADSGCRVGDRAAAEVERDVDDVPLAPGAATTEALERLGLTEEGRRTERFECPSGGALWSVTLLADKPARPLPEAVAPGVTAVLSGTEVVAYDTADVGVAVRLRGEQVLASATTKCG